MKIKKIANSLKNLRKIHELTAAELSNILQLDLNSIKSYEMGKINPSIPVLVKIFKYFNISLDFLILGKKTPYVQNLELLLLAEKIDKLDVNDRYKVEASSAGLIGKFSNPEIKLDEIEVELNYLFSNNLKQLRKYYNLTQKNLALKINVSRVQIAKYEKSSFPNINKLIVLSELFNISIHALLTGQKLFYNFNNKGLLSIILKADKILTLQDHQFLIKLMQRIIEDSE